jgi:hypothetical protein
LSEVWFCIEIEDFAPGGASSAEFQVEGSRNGSELPDNVLEDSGRIPPSYTPSVGSAGGLAAGSYALATPQTTALGPDNVEALS